MRVLRRAVGGVLLALLATTGPASAAAPLTPAQLLRRAPAMPGGEVELFDAAGRPFAVHRPAEVQRGLPLVIAVTGHQVPATFWDSIGLGPHAEALGYLVAYAEPLDGSFNAGICCDPSRRLGRDDEGYLRRIRSRLVDAGLADPSRVFLLGFSNGDMLSMQTGCDHPTEFAAVAGAAGDFPQAEPATCTGLRVLHLHGVRDEVVPPGGGYNQALDMTSQPIATLPERMRGAEVLVRPVPCGHVFPTLANPCRLSGIDVALGFFTATPSVGS